MRWELIIILFLVSGCVQVSDELDWRNAKGDGTFESYENYLIKYPGGRHEADAMIAIEDLVWMEVQRSNEISDFQGYLDMFPGGRYASVAVNNIEDIIWMEVQNSNTERDYGKYLEMYPSGRYASDAKKAGEALIWKQVEKIDTVEIYKAFLKEFPDGRYEEQARKAIEDIKLEIEKDKAAIKDVLMTQCAAFAARDVDAAMVTFHPDSDMASPSSIESLRETVAATTTLECEYTIIDVDIGEDRETATVNLDTKIVLDGRMVGEGQQHWEMKKYNGQWLRFS
ncbi:MAG: hypothetical protein V3W37_03505 [Candidatus Binatia bacterium]